MDGVVGSSWLKWHQVKSHGGGARGACTRGGCDIIEIMV